jgi:hypothetical protein
MLKRSVVSLLLLFGAVTSHAAEFHWKNDAATGADTLMFGETPVIRYMRAYDPSTEKRREETYKVYHHVFSPQSGALITKGAGGKFPHHRGLYVGWNKTQFEDQNLDFWHCRKGEHFEHKAMMKQTAAANSGSMTAAIQWIDREGKVVISEQRTITVTRIKVSNGPAWQIDWSTILETRRGDIKLRGDRQHSGFQFRAAQSVADANSARYIRPANQPQQPEAFQVSDKKDPDKHVDLGWFAMTCEIDGKRNTVEYFEYGAPNQSHYSERPYGRFGAFYEADITEVNPIKMTYRVIVSEGKAPTRDEIQKRYDAFRRNPFGSRAK